MTAEWRARAACRGTAIPGWGSAHDPRRDGELDQEFRSRMAEAKRICRTCPVTAECLTEARAHHEVGGVWGGRVLSGPDRESMPYRNEARHGTESGAKSHRRRGEVPCGPCRVAEAARVDARRRHRKVRAL